MRPLPDTSQWLPKSDKRAALRSTFLQTCRSVEARIIAEADIEKNFNINNFDAGPGFEDIVREQFRMLLPDRYAVTPGVIIDSDGDNCGDCDLVIANRIWSPLLKYGATDESRRIHIPVEAVYTVIEVKQTLTEASLDDAMKKLVTYKRLKRSRSGYGQINENQNIIQFNRPGVSLNYRFDAILGGGCENATADDLATRFFKVNETLAPSARVNALAILGSGYACYGVKTPDGNWEHLYPESTMAHLYTMPEDDIVIETMYLSTPQDTLYLLYTNLWQHLTLTVLNPPNLKVQYGRDLAAQTILEELSQRGQTE